MKKRLTLEQWIVEDQKKRLKRTEGTIKRQHTISPTGTQAAKFFDKDRKLVRHFTSKLEEMRLSHLRRTT